MGLSQLIIIDVQEGFINEWTSHVPQRVEMLQDSFDLQGELSLEECSPDSPLEGRLAGFPLCKLLENMAASNGVAGDHGDEWLGAVSHLALQVEDVESVGAEIVGVASFASYRLIASRAKGLLTLPREDNDADISVVASASESVP